MKQVLPKNLPGNWKQIPDPRLQVQDRVPENFRWYQHASRISVCISVQLISGKWWLHVSLSRPDRLPNWDEYRGVKLLFCGPQRQAIQVLPKETSYVNVHPHCLHLFCCLEPGGDGLPDFTEYV